VTKVARTLFATVLVSWVAAGPVRAIAQAAQPANASLQQPATEEFVPVSELPPEDQLPAAPLLIAAYVIVWAGLLVYVWFVWRRLQRIEGELARIETRLPGRGAPR
jgi:CcmD family protein